MKKVILYTTDTCPYCTQAKAFLKQEKIHFQEKNASRDPAAQQEMATRNLRGVPAFLIGEDVVVGLDKEQVLRLVDHRLVSCPTCQASLRLPTGKGKIKATCPKCSTTFEWQG
jgi:glutaredoxin